MAKTRKTQSSGAPRAKRYAIYFLDSSKGDYRASYGNAEQLDAALKNGWKPIRETRSQEGDRTIVVVLESPDQR